MNLNTYRVFYKYRKISNFNLYCYLLQAFLLIFSCICTCLFVLKQLNYSKRLSNGGLEYKGRYADYYIPYYKDDSIMYGTNKTCPNTFVPEILIIVCSSTRKSNLRSAIRETWGKEAENYNMTVLFMVGYTGDHYLDSAVIQENNMYNDVIVEPFQDSYFNLTLKSIMLLKWAKDNCNQAPFVMKTDDDIYLNIPNLHDAIRNDFKHGENVLVGKMGNSIKADRKESSKWYVSEEVYPEEKYPDFLYGVGYLMSRDVALKLYDASFQQELFILEDIFITGTCADLVNIKRQDHMSFHLFTKHVGDIDCESVHRFLILLGHYISPSNMRKLHSQLEICRKNNFINAEAGL